MDRQRVVQRSLASKRVPRPCLWVTGAALARAARAPPRCLKNPTRLPITKFHLPFLMISDLTRAYPSLLARSVLDFCSARPFFQNSLFLSYSPYRGVFSFVSYCFYSLPLHPAHVIVAEALSLSLSFFLSFLFFFLILLFFFPISLFPLWFP